MPNSLDRAVRFSGGSDDDEAGANLAMQNLKHALREVEDEGSSPESNGADLHAIERHDDLGSLSRYADAPNGLTGLPPASHINGGPPPPKAQRPSGGEADAPYLQRPMGPIRTPSNTYNPSNSRKPAAPQPQPSFSESVRSSSKTRPRQSDSRFRAQERAYVQTLRQGGYTGEYFGQFQPQNGNDSDSEGETPSSEGPFDDRLDQQETIMFYGNDEIQPTEEDIAIPENRERLEWHSMLEAVLTGDVVRQEKKRLINSTDTTTNRATYRQELWLELRAEACGRRVPVQKRMVEDGRAMVDKLLDDVINFEVKGTLEAGKPPFEQVKDVVKKIEKCQSMYPSWNALVAEHKSAVSPQFLEAYEAIMSWYNTNEMINTELAILKKWVGNDELDFSRTKQRSPAVDGITTDETSFLDRLMKEDGLQSLYNENAKVILRGDLVQWGMLVPISNVIKKAKETLIRNSAPFQKRHLPPYLDELLTLISFPSRLIEEITKTRLAYARRVKETAQQNPLMQDQMISQFQLLLQFAIRIKTEYLEIEKPEPGWELPPCIDESFDQVALEALKYYFKMLNWKLSGNKNTFKEAELLFQEWDFANDIGGSLHRGNIEVAEQFSSLTFKALNRLATTFERELQIKPKESAADMSKRYKAALDSVRVRQRMLQRFSRMLSENYEHACDFSISLPPDQMQLFYDHLVASGHFQVDTHGVFETLGIYLIASPEMRDRLDDVQAMLAITSADRFPDDSGDQYILILRPEDPFVWIGEVADVLIKEQNIDLKRGQIRLCTTGSNAIAHARRNFLDAIDMHIDLLQESRSNIHKVNTRLTEIRRVAYKLSNTFMDSVEIIRKQTQGKDCQELIQTCFIFATEFGQRSLLYMDSNRRQMNNLKLTKLALDWVSFICDDCVASDRRTFRWAVLALEFAMGMTRGRHILALGEEEYERIRAKVGGCMSVLISHFDIMGARSSLAAQAEKERIENLVSQFRKDKNKMLDDDEASMGVTEQRLEKLNRVDEFREGKEAERRALGRVLETTNEADRSLAYLSASATNVTVRWQQGQFVGGGTFGNVYAAMNLDTGHLMAVKEIRLQDPKLIPTIAESIREEMRVLEVLDHPNVVSYHGIEVHRDRVYIFMEFCSGGSLANLLEHGRIEEEEVIMVYALQLLEGLAYLHESGIAHRDIKPENILLDHNGIIKYVDFGAAKLIARQGRTMAADLHATKPNKSMTGTPMYMSPEVIKGENPGKAGAVDIWSLGCVILEMATGRRPWANLDNEWAIMYNIAQGNPPQLPSPEQLSPQGIDFLTRCFARDPKQRSSAMELLQHEWIMTIRNQVVEPATPSDASGSSQSPFVSATSTRNSIGPDGFY
ncbi:map kinase [Trichoderma citrinoviride]|uniref:MAP kinase kinase kinase n=1 Tax=Trichoderma citrinoviride TaxID=58853 RepID=A0A2T4B566_9HYPO|nr:map kinase [Trichoderma citrinoviride]PTB64464.1 map kinase [Trichoderma citrinoviride]